jgi:hypothetical protein
VTSDPDLALVKRGSVTAAAGCGKTELIARSVATGAGERELILTHTNAGVDALRRRLRERGVSADRFAIDTIAGWCLKYVASYPKLSGFDDVRHDQANIWPSVYRSAAKLMQTDVARSVLSASYSGLYVDEYQDCLVEQHAIITQIGAVLSTRVLGDPLQSVFRFGDNNVVAWTQVESDFPPVATLTTPHRWLRAGASADLGVWLQSARTELEVGRPVDLSGSPVQWVRSTPTWQAEAQRASFDVAQKTGTVVGVGKWPSTAQHVGTITGGLFQCIEPIEGRPNLGLVACLDDVRGDSLVNSLFRVLAAISTGAGDHRQMLQRGTPGVELADTARALAVAAESPDGLTIAEALRALSSMRGVRVHRRELLYAICDALADHHAGQGQTFVEAFRRRRNMTSRVGRRLARCCIGSTLLVKGMQFDHGIIFDSGEFSASDTYVALTRACSSLTVVSPNPVLRPV